MSMILEKNLNQIKVFIPNSEAAINVQLKGISNSSVGSYYIDDKKENYIEIQSFLNNNYVYNLNVKFVNKLIQDIEEKVFEKYRHLFKGGLVDLGKSKQYFQESKELIAIPNMFFAGENNRYLKFENSNETIKFLKNILLGGITGFYIVKTNSHYEVRPFLREDVLSILDHEAAKLEQKLDLVEEEINNKYNKEDFLEEVFITNDKYDSIVTMLQNKKNIILQGAPGVGKTFIAKRLAYSIMGEKRPDKTLLIQFHQSYSYEEFIEGYRPTKKGFDLIDGVFKNFCKKAKQNPDENYYLIIDEINRGNLSKIFGELLMLIETDKRQESLILPYSQEEFSVPSNIFIIGLMNTADRSLAMIDYALRRRFAFITIEPAFDNRKFIEHYQNIFDHKYDEVINVIKSLNEYIEKDYSLGKGFKIGHSYFCLDLERGKGDIKHLIDIINYEIIPLLEEYWFDDEDQLINWVEKLERVIDASNR